ncbi:MAG: hypothetical protein ABWZ76_11555 [Acidimicrobiales bacterium]
MAPQDDLHAARTAGSNAKSIPEVATELWEMAKAYAQQETIDPLKGLGRFLAYGISGAILLGLGVLLMLLSLLRALQTQTGTTFTGNLTWVPYLITVAVGLVLIALALRRVTKRKGPSA